MNRIFTRFTIIVLLVLGLFSACKKEERVEIPKEFPVQLTAERWELRVKTRLFSNNVEISDPTLVRAFEEREGLKELFEEPFELSEQLPVIHFDSEHDGQFTAGAEQRSFEMERKGTRFIFYSLGRYSLNPMAPPSDHSLGYFHSMLKYSDSLGQPNADGDRQTRTVWVGHGNFKVLKMSAFAYVLKIQGDASPEGNFWRDEGVFPNEFNEKAIKHLKTSDTLAVREYSIIYSLVN